MAGILIVAGALFSWMSGCSDLEEDCELLVNCPDIKDPPQCNSKYYSPRCDACLQTHCCQEASDCSQNIPCGTYCMFGIMPPSPDCNTGQTGEYFGALTSCMKTNCAAECSDENDCNPITHSNCAQDGSQCEFFYPGIFFCIPPEGTPALLCESCNFTKGPYCGSGLRCEVNSLKCARYCCTNADCGTGVCELNQNAVLGFSTLDPTDMVGLCMAMAPGTGPACDAPFPPPSGGTCFAGFAP
jgi:hypothetical protein